jgi:hypothetical protein
MGISISKKSLNHLRKWWLAAKTSVFINRDNHLKGLVSKQEHSFREH